MAARSGNNGERTGPKAVVTPWAMIALIAPVALAGQPRTSEAQTAAGQPAAGQPAARAGATSPGTTAPGTTTSGTTAPGTTTPGTKAAPGRKAAAPAKPRTEPARPSAAKPEQEIVYRRLHPIPLPARTRTYEEATSDEDQLRAEELFKKGNRKFEQRDLDEAIRYYKQAHRVWPHPRILYNIAINLGYLSNPLESARKFRKVLEYRPGPIQPKRYQEAAETYRRLMRRLSTVQVVCNDKNARVFVDGRSMGTAPIDTTVTVMPGRHLVSAKLQGKVPYTAEVNVMMGYKAIITVVMRDFADVVKYKTVKRYRWYWPTAVTAVAAIALAVGTGLWITGRNSILDLKDGIDADFTSVKGPVAYPTGTENRAVALQKAGQAMVGIGAAAAAASIALWLLRTKRVKFTEETAPSGTGGGVKVRF